MPLRQLFIILPLICSGMAMHAQSPDTLHHAPSYAGSYISMPLQMVKAPANWNREQWFQMGGSVAIVGALIPMDNVLNLPFENWQSPFARRFGKTGDVMGNLPFQLGVSGLAIGAGYLAGQEKWRLFGLDNLQAQIFTGGITFLFKEAFHRARPNTGEDNYTWYGPFKGRGNDSFFSGHTSLAFTTATMLYYHSGEKWWVGLAGYSLATGVGLSRMQQQKHWASDVVAGALVGTTVAAFVYKQQEKRRLKRAQPLKPLP